MKARCAISKPVAALALLAAFTAGASALTVSVTPFGGPAFAPKPDAPGAPAGYVATGCMSAIFDAGHIATESVPAFVARESWEKAPLGLAEARAGKVDYLIDIYVEWVDSAFVKGADLPSRIDYRLVRVRDGEVLGNGSVPGIADSEDAARHEARSAALAGARAAEPCLQLLETLVMGGE
jgi:hypothetical protein